MNMTKRVLAPASAVLALIAGLSTIASTSTDAASICTDCESGCVFNHPDPDDGDGHVEWITDPTLDDGDCDTLEINPPPCTVDEKCEMVGILKFKNTSGALMQYEITNNGTKSGWLPLAINYTQSITFLPTWRLDCGRDLGEGEMVQSEYKIEFVYLSGEQWHDSDATWSFTCSVCQSVAIE